MTRIAARCRLLMLSAAIASTVSILAGQDSPLGDATPAPPPRAPRVLASPRPPEPVSRQITTEQIAAWVQNLDADEFLERETAMLQLLEAGPAALPALRPVLLNGGLEPTSRALYVVRQIGLAANADGQDQAGQLLAELAQRTEAPALARRAAATLVELTQQRSAHALEELEALGAKVTRSEWAGALPFDDPALSVEIGDEFTGADNDLRRLKWVVAAPQLILTGNKANDNWLAHAATMPSLEKLHIYQAAITDNALAPLAESSSLRELGIYYSQVTDRILDPLTRLPLLSFVKLYGTKVSDSAYQKFRENTGVAVDYRRGAFLGVGCQDPESCRISTVHVNSPAAKGGLVTNDVIVRFVGQDVKDFEALTDLIRKCEVGDEVAIQVLRASSDDHNQPTLKKVTAQLKLAPWDLEPAVKNGRR